MESEKEFMERIISEVNTRYYADMPITWLDIKEDSNECVDEFAEYMHDLSVGVKANGKVPKESLFLRLLYRDYLYWHEN